MMNHLICSISFVTQVESENKKDLYTLIEMSNLAGCVTGFWLRNWMPSCTTGHPDVLPESLPILLINQATTPHRRLCNRWDFSSHCL